MTMRSQKKLPGTRAVIGEWHLAFVTAAGLGKLGHSVTLVKPEGKWEKSPRLELEEPGLNEAIDELESDGRFEHCALAEMGEYDEIWLAIDTPVNDRDEADIEPLLAAAKQVRQKDVPFVVTSQVPLGFCNDLEKELGLRVACVPENLRLGKGLETFLRADRVVIGASSDETREKVRDSLSGVDADFVLCDLITAEMIKHATNAFLATSISFSNELARIGEAFGADCREVGFALKKDKRIGRGAYVVPGLGFAGGTLPRDLRVLQKIGAKAKLRTPLVDSVLEINESVNHSIAQSLERELGGLEGKKIAILGYSYKPEIDTLRRSPALEMTPLLKGAQLYGFDPRMNERDLAPLEGKIEHQAEWGFEFDAALILTARPEFKDLNWSQAKGLVFDTVGALEPEPVLSAGLDYKALWQPVMRRG